MTKETALSVEGVSYAFQGEAALIEDLSFEMRPKEFVSFLGPSGIGKSTVFRLVSGLLEPQGGRIAVAGGSGSRLGRVGYMPQRDALMPWRTVLQNAALGLELQGASRREAEERVRGLLPSFGLAGTEDKLPQELSGGMRQRVSFLRAMLHGSGLLLLDEPFSALDAMTRVAMQEWLLEVWERHRTTVLFITHDIEEALLLSDRVLVAADAPLRRLAEVAVPLPRPRSYETTLSGEFVALKRRVLGLLRAPGGATGGGSTGAPAGAAGSAGTTSADSARASRAPGEAAGAAPRGGSTAEPGAEGGGGS